jgi:hypothetical protein
MEDGEELQMFVVRILLWIRQRCFHGEDITTITPKGLLKSQSRLPTFVRTIRNGAGDITSDLLQFDLLPPPATCAFLRPS